jgi:DUF2075 family protein
MLEISEREAAGWAGTVTELLLSDADAVVRRLENFVTQQLRLAVEPPQRKAWRECHVALAAALRMTIAAVPSASSWGVVLEYELPRERGRRPDVVVITPGPIMVLEFKSFFAPEIGHLDQVRAYARDLEHYHAASRGRPVKPILVLTTYTGSPHEVDGVIVTGPQDLGSILSNCASTSRALDAAEVALWVQGDYAPLPTLVRAARAIFEHEPLPRIRRAESAGVPQALAALNAIVETAIRKGGRHLSLLTGVPGAGKTLVGLQFVYLLREKDDDARPAVFLSGNGPLVEVLQHALQSRVFVQDVHGFLQSYGGGGRRTPEERVWVYDEAQRAWDADRVREKRGHGFSEPEDFLRLGARVPGSAVIVGLIGEGQEIHLGEEAGLRQWNDALRVVGGEWIVHCPPRLADHFSAAQVVATPDLDLTTTLRSHLASDQHRWVGLLLEGDLSSASEVAAAVRSAAFVLYVSRDLDAITTYVRQRYTGEFDKRYGLLVSSKGTVLQSFGMDNSYAATKRVRLGQWYNDDASSPFSCCQFRELVTEFSCQGLELDFPVIGWGDDLVWLASRWQNKPGRSRARDPHRLRINSYRVLLTRGRDGMAIFVPPISAMDATHEALLRAGAIEL